MFAPVAPFAGAWIEIMSNFKKVKRLFVAPFAGAWIEISSSVAISKFLHSRSLRGSVD